MTSKQFTPYLLAGSLLLSGAFFVPQAEARIETLPAARAEDTRVTSIDDLGDVSAHHWAYDAVKELVEKYDVIEGYPAGKDGKSLFKGQQFVTRYEMAAALRDLLQGGKVVSTGDMNALNQLRNEFAPELAALDARTEALEARTTVLENNALKAVKIGGDFSVGGLSNFTTGEKNGANPNLTAIVSRLRLTVEAPIVEDKEDSKLGEGRLKARLVAAAGNNGGGFNGLTRIGSDASAYNEHLMATGNAQNSNTRLNAYFDRVVYEQEIKHGVPILSNLYIAELLGKDNTDKNWQAGGTLFGGLVPWRDYFDKSAYRGNENDQFQNNGFVNIPGLASNLTSSSVGYAMFQNLGENTKLNVTTAFGASNPADALNYYTASYEARLNYNWANLDNRKSALYAGGIHVFNDGNATTTVPATLTDRGGVNNFGRTPSHTVFAGLDQEIYKGIGVNLGYMYNNVRQGDVVLNGLNQNNGTFRRGISPRQAISAVLHVPTATLGFRDGDTFGVGYAMVDFQDSLSTSAADRFEQIGEAYYNFKVNDRLSLIPSLQLGSKIAGTNTNDLSYAAGFRASVKF
jgi:hypothetical protein